MELSPLRYAIGTITIWHWLVLLGFAGLSLRIFVAGNSGASMFHDSLPGLMLGCFIIVWMYFLAAPMVGQLFGDRFPFAMIWPSALLMGCLMAGAFLAFVLTSEGKPMTRDVATLAVVVFPLFSALLALFVCIALYAMPRAAGFGLVGWPKASWGVHL